MPNKLKTYFNWSTGKDASLALYKLKKDKTLLIDKLLTSVNGHHNRVSMHGLRRELLQQQAKLIGIPLETIELPEQPTMDDYSKIMNSTVKQLKNEGYTNCGFGDIFLEDLKTYREQQLKPHAITCHFPLWKKDTKQIITEFINLGFKAIVICTNAKLLDASFVGREINHSFINDLPKNVDSCGENGEFHTFCYDGPIFSEPVKFIKGENVYKTYKAPNQNNNDTKTLLGFGFVIYYL